jgi:uncharacterized protein YndB with AHSA1/START domain
MTLTADAEGWIAGEKPGDGEIRRIGEDRYEIRIVRQIPRPVEKVWAALTIPERLEAWMGERAELDLRVGGRYIVWFPGPTNDGVLGTITDYDPPHLLAYDWNGGSGDLNIRWALAAEADGCRLTFSTVCRRTTEPGINAWWVLGGFAGWRGFMDDLSFAVTGEAAAEADPMDHPAMVARYRRHFGPSVPGSDKPATLRHHEADGYVLETSPGFYSVRFDRFMMVPIEKIWAALTEPARLGDWFADTAIDLRLGGEVEFRHREGDAERGFIVALKAPELLAWAIPGPDGRHSVVRWDLKQEASKTLGTRLTLTNTFLPVNHLLSVATGWHIHLHELPEAALRDTPLPWSPERERARLRAEQVSLTPRYRSRLPREAVEAAVVEAVG